jgi:Na+-driven multidrug efflux pump
MVIALVGLPLNVATNYGLVVLARWQYVGAAFATSLAAG